MTLELIFRPRENQDSTLKASCRGLRARCPEGKVGAWGGGGAEANPGSPRALCHWGWGGGWEEGPGALGAGVDFPGPGHHGQGAGGGKGPSLSLGGQPHAPIPHLPMPLVGAPQVSRSGCWAKTCSSRLWGPKMQGTGQGSRRPGAEGTPAVGMFSAFLS